MGQTTRRDITEVVHVAAIPAEHLGVRAPRAGFLPWIWDWLSVVDHKRIGILYLAAAILFMGAAGTEALLIRLQLFRPDNTFVSPQLFNQLFTVHGVSMIFLVVMPMLMGGFGNVLLPLMIGARDVAFPRLNALSFWLFFLGGIFVNSGWFLGGAPNAGWFAYAPISSALYNPGHGLDWYAIGVQITGFGTLMTGVNFLATIVNMRAPGMTYMRLPLFVWTILVTSILIIFAFPPLTIDLFELTFDRLFNMQFFNPTSGGSALLWANLFWIFGHPEVYIMILPAFGIISEIVTTFARKPLFGYSTMVVATMAIGFLSFMVWVHHMFTLGYGPWVNSIFAVTSFIIGVPTGVKIFNWLSTLWGGSIQYKPALMFAAAFIVQFAFGGITGIMVAMAPADFQYNDSYFLVAHFHYVLGAGALFALLAAWHYWFPKITGRLMNETLGTIQFWLSFVGINTLFLPMHWLGLMGMPRRIATYAPGLGLTFWNQVCTVGAFILATGMVIFVINILWSAGHGKVAGNDPWDGRTLEWATASPPPVYNFAEVPLVRGRDPVWLEKEYGTGHMIPAPGEEGRKHTHLPAPTAVPAFLAAGVGVLAYAALYKNEPIMIAGVVISLVALYVYMFRTEREIEVELEPDPQHRPPSPDPKPATP